MYEYESNAFQGSKELRDKEIEKERLNKLNKENSLKEDIELSRKKLLSYKDNDVIEELMDKIISNSLQLDNNDDVSLISKYEDFSKCINKYIRLSKEMLKLADENDM